MYQVDNLVKQLHVAARTAELVSGVQFAPCARCGAYHRLLKADKLWIQPEHSCGDEYHAREAVNG